MKLFLMKFLELLNITLLGYLLLAIPNYNHFSPPKDNYYPDFLIITSCFFFIVISSKCVALHTVVYNENLPESNDLSFHL